MEQKKDPVEVEQKSPNAEKLLEQATRRLTQINHPLAQPVSQALKSATHFIFAEANQKKRQERQVMLPLLKLFARNNWPLGLQEGKPVKSNGVIKKGGGVILEAAWRVNYRGDNFLLLSASGYINLSHSEVREALSEFFKRTGVAATCTPAIEACLSSSRGPKLIVCTDEEGIILEAKTSKSGPLSIDSPAFHEPLLISQQTPTGLHEVITTAVYPPRTEITL